MFTPELILELPLMLMVEVTVDLGGLSAGTDIMGPVFCCMEKV